MFSRLMRILFESMMLYALKIELIFDENLHEMHILNWMFYFFNGHQTEKKCNVEFLIKLYTKIFQLYEGTSSSSINPS